MAAEKKEYYNYPLRLHKSHQEDLHEYAKREKLSVNDVINIAVGALLIATRKQKKPKK